MGNPVDTPLRLNSADGQLAPHATRLRRAVALVIAIWAVGVIGHFTPLAEWPALFLYVLGAIGLTVFHCARADDWRGAFVTRHNLGAALAWGGGAGLLLAVVGTANTLIFYASGGKLMAQMQTLLVELGLLYFFPLLALAEELLWRGLLLSGLLDRGVNPRWAIALTTLAYMVNHFFVAPVGWAERGMMALMGLPIGVMAGYLVFKTRNVWSAVVLHTIIMAAMMLIVFVIPGP
ncbi:MAG: CPBP family glutamic-type intramembrane protease [Candidatus Roseilinea sp.]|uniref:CPBP family glutamic-type intramembrane protease n=1 Tax=Candidatus Roseilinea sp. TaxID=2838777 RepID=UPI00404A622E